MAANSVAVATVPTMLEKVLVIGKGSSAVAAHECHLLKVLYE